MFCVIYDCDNKYGVIDTNDEVVEEYTKEELINIVTQYKVNVVGVENGEISAPFHAYGYVSKGSVEHFKFLNYHLIFITSCYNYRSAFKILLYNEETGKYGGCVGLDGIDNEYLYCNFWENNRSDMFACVEASVQYTDKHYYGEDKEQEFEYVLEFYKENAEDKLKIKRVTKGFIELHR